jgi:DNA topoisomerase VI subunit A
MSAAILERRHFTIPRANEYFTPDGLQKETGQPLNQFRHMALKELLDNALDAAESAGNAPDILVEFTESENGLTLTIADNGRGIPAQVVERILGDFSASTSDKACYRSPMRGAQGNAFKTVIGMPVALGADRSRLAIAAASVQHDIEVWVSPAGDVRHTHHQSTTETQGTRITVMIPGSPECYYWNPNRWLFAYSLFNPHAQLQIRKIAPVWESRDENEHPDLALESFSDLSLTPTVAFSDGRWRKFLPTDPTPAHWYTPDEFSRLVHRIAGQAPDQFLGGLIQEFKGTSRNWRTIQKAVSAKTVVELADSATEVAALHSALLTINPAPRPEVLGRVGPDHFRQRIDERFKIISDRSWYKHQWGIAEGMPYLIEVAIAETERPGDVFYGLNYSVPFSDPLSTTTLIYDGQERLENQGLTAFLKDTGVFNGTRYGKTINTAAAVHLVMPLLPTLDRGKSRLEISADLATAIAETIATAAKVLTKEFVIYRKHQERNERATREQQWERVSADQKERARLQKEIEAQAEKEEREKQRQLRQKVREVIQAKRQERGEKPTKREAVFNLLLPTYLIETENETLRISCRDLFYAVRPLYQVIDVRASKKRNGDESTELNFGYFGKCVSEFRHEQHKLSQLDYKARGTLYECHSGREIPIGDKELRHYVLPKHEYAGILFIEKEGVWETLKETGGIELAKKYDLIVVSCVGYANEAARRLLAKAQDEAGWKIFIWHDADPHGYNICRTAGEATERMPDHHVDLINIGLRLEEGLAMGLPTETFTRKNALPAGILPALTDKELEAFTGDEYRTKDKQGKEKREWRNCQRIEINAIKVRDRVAYLESKITPAFQAKPTAPGETPTPTARPPIETIHDATKAMIDRVINDHIRDAIAERINLDAIAALAKKEVTTLPIMDEILQSALDADAAAPWRDVVRQYAVEAIDEQQIGNINQAVISAIWENLKGMPRSYEVTA